MCVWHDLFVRMAWRIHMCDMTHPWSNSWAPKMFPGDVTHLCVWFDWFVCVSYVSRDWFICTYESWLIHMYMIDSYESIIRHIPESYCMCLMWHIPYGSKSVSHMCLIIDSCVWHDSFIGVTWLIHRCDMTHSWSNSWAPKKILSDMTHACVWSDWFICATSLIHMSHSTLMNESCHTHESIRRHIWDTLFDPYCMCHIVDSYVCRDLSICVTWLIHGRILELQKCSLMTWPIHICDMTDSYVCHDVFIRVTWLIHVCDMTYSGSNACAPKIFPRDMTLQHTATHCNTRNGPSTLCNTRCSPVIWHCNTLQRTSTHCNTLQHTATHCNTLQRTATHCNTLQRTATHCNTLQHTHWICNTLQYKMFPRDMTYLYVWHESLKWATWLIDMRHDSLTQPCHISMSHVTYQWVMSHIITWITHAPYIGL